MSDVGGEAKAGDGAVTGTRAGADAVALLQPIERGLPQVEIAARLPRGFRVGGGTAGIKASGRPDLALVVVDGPPAAVAATFTTNRVPAAPVLLDREHLALTGVHEPGAAGAGATRAGGAFGRAQALMSTSGCANAATGEAGLADQRALAEALATAVGCSPELTLHMSTGLIGTRLPVSRIVPALTRMVFAELRSDDNAWADAGEALMTTDSRPKSASVRLTLPDASGAPVAVTVSGVAKGVGMIHPRMATMLCFVLTDAAADAVVLSGMLRPIVARTWDQASVDGDQSTNDTVLLVASGASGAAPVVPGSAPAGALAGAVEAVARSLARQQAADGEGATTLVTCGVTGARDDAEAQAVARSVVTSSLVKAAVHGADPNWGRIVAAVGNAHLADAAVLEAAGLPAEEAARRGGAPVEIDPARLRVALCGVPVFSGAPLPFDKPALSRHMRADEVLVRVDLGEGRGSGEAFGCDLTEEYVVENSAYST